MIRKFGNCIGQSSWRHSSLDQKQSWAWLTARAPLSCLSTTWKLSSKILSFISQLKCAFGMPVLYHSQTTARKGVHTAVVCIYIHIDIKVRRKATVQLHSTKATSKSQCGTLCINLGISCDDGSTCSWGKIQNSLHLRLLASRTAEEYKWK